MDELTVVLRQFGLRIADEPDQLRAALTRALGPASADRQNEVTALVAVARHGWPSQFRTGGSTSSVTGPSGESRIDILTTTGIAPATARWALETWAAALGALDSTRLIDEHRPDEETRLEPGPWHPGLQQQPPPPRTIRLGPDPYAETLLAHRSPAAGPGQATAVVVPGFGPPSAAPGPFGGPPSTIALAAAAAPSAPPRSGGWLSRWWPSLAAGLAAVVVCAVSLPAILANLVPLEPADGAVTEGQGYPVLAGTDRTQLVLDLADLRSAFDGPTVGQAAAPMQDRGVEQTWVVAVSDDCARMLSLAPPRTEGSSDLWGSTVSTLTAQVVSTARAYPTAADAAAALDQLRQGDCREFTVTVEGGDILAQRVEVAALSGRTVQGHPWVGFRDRTTLFGQSPYPYERWCAAVTRLLVCHVAVGPGSSLAAPKDLAAAAEQRVNQVAGHRPEPPRATR